MWLYNINSAYRNSTIFLRKFFKVLLVSIAVLMTSAAVWLLTRPAPDIHAGAGSSLLVVDRNGVLLRPFTAPDGRWRLNVTASQVDARFISLLKAYEDRRFDSHWGVDPLALLRAVGQMTRARKIISGGSTLTMQMVRLLDADRRRSFSRKLNELAAAFALERSIGKAAVLDMYLTRAPYGGNLEGVRAASLAYFGKEPRRLSLAETALLIAISQSPEARRPDRFPAAARRSRDDVLNRLVKAGFIQADDAQSAKAEPVPVKRLLFPMLAAHTAEAAHRLHPRDERVQLTIDARLQAHAEDLAKARAWSLGAFHSAAVMIVEHKTGIIRASVGAADYFDTRRAGSVDQTRAVRSPGSALKPFIYGMAFEEGAAHPETLIDDQPSQFASYAPKNFDMHFQGTVSVRQALQMSLNIPAVAVLETITPQRFVTRLRQAGVALQFPENALPSLAVALGGTGISLHDLTTLFAGLARGGSTVPLTVEPLQKMPVEQRLLEPRAAWQTAHILLGTPAPVHNAGGHIAFKTGTSYGYRDAWAVGFDGTYVVAVWLGRPDGASSAGLVARDVAAPLMFDLFARMGPERTSLAPAPAGTLNANNAEELPPPLRRFRPATAVATPLAASEQPLSITFPPDGAKVELLKEGEGSAVALKASGGRPPFTWLVDGKPVAPPNAQRESLYSPASSGFLRITVMDGAGSSASAQVKLE
jgi:penicillin-binding protein 1C